MPTRNIYSEFNAQLEAIITRPITPTEFKQYYDFIETYHVEPDALTLVAKHCVDVKGPSVGYNYILTVAKRMAYDGARTEKVMAAMIDKTKKELEQEAQKKLERAVKKTTAGKEKKILRHSYKDGELQDKFKTTNLDEVEI